MKEGLFDLPVSLHVFNRPETTSHLFDIIKKIRPKQLFITADGPRENKPDDIVNCHLTRSIVTNINWECKLHTNFSKINKGSYKSTSEGITWVFNHVEKALFLEDDCIPHISFFKFCENLLEYYENDSRIALISGTDFTNLNTTHSYYFSRYTHLWGWAAWKRTWDKVDFSMSDWPSFRDNECLKALFKSRHEEIYWKRIMQDMYEKKIGPHWDYLLLLSMFMNNTLAIRPTQNLISNTGYGDNSTHFIYKTRMHENHTYNMKLPLSHPRCVCRNYRAEYLSDLIEFSGGNVGFIKSEIKKIILQLVLKLKSTRKPTT